MHWQVHLAELKRRIETAEFCLQESAWWQAEREFNQARRALNSLQAESAVKGGAPITPELANDMPDAEVLCIGHAKIKRCKHCDGRVLCGLAS